MTLDELREALIPLALALRADFDLPTQRAYFRVLKDVPLPLLVGAVEAAGREPDLKFLPTAPEWRGRCERERVRIMALDPYEACLACHGIGTVRISHPGELRPRYGRCACWHAYLRRMEARGVTERPLAQLPAARGELAENTAVMAADDLPPGISARVRHLASDRRMR